MVISNGRLSPPATKLLLTTLDSKDKLELAATLARATGRTASLLDLIRETQLPPAVVRRVVGELDSSHIVEMTSRGLVRLVTGKDFALVQEILDLYGYYPQLLLSILAQGTTT